jgi:hypothetical protein
LQHRLAFAGVAHRLARFLDRCGEGRRGHMQARPQVVEQFVGVCVVRVFRTEDGPS